MSAFDHAVFRLLLDEYLKDVFERESPSTPDPFQLSLLESCLQDLDGRVTFYYRRYAPDLYDPESSKTAWSPFSNAGCCGGLGARRWLGTPLGVHGCDVGCHERRELLVARVGERGEAHRLMGHGSLEQVADEAGVTEAAAA